MKKSLIALTLAALPVAAMADVTLYGQVKAGVEISRINVHNNGVKSHSATATEIADFGSRIGFKGHEHLGNNLNAIWQIEQKTSVAGTDSGWGTRESFIGLEGGFGKIRAGKLDTTVKDSSDNIDTWDYSNPALGLGMFTRVDERKISARYDSPVFGGFSASVQYVPRDTANPGDKYNHEKPAEDRYYAGLNYANSGFFAQYAGGFAKNTYEDTSNKLHDGQLHRLVLGYDANNLLVAVAGQYTKRWESLDQYYNKATNGGYEAQLKAQTPAQELADNADIKTTEVAATVAYRLGNVTPRLSYAHGFKAKDVETKEKYDLTQYHNVVVGADYDFSKRTSALISAGWLKAGKGDNRVEHTAGLVGLRHKF